MHQEISKKPQILKSTVLGVLLIDKKGNIIESNERASAILETQSLFLKNKNIFELLDSAELTLDIKANLSEGVWNGLSQENNLLHVQYSFTKSNTQATSGYYGTLIITKQPILSLVDLRNDHQLKSVLSTEVLGLGVIDQSRRFCDINQAALNLLGYSRDEMIGKTWEEIGLLKSEFKPHLDALLDRLFQTGKIQKFEISVLRKNGTNIDLLLSVDTFASFDQTFYLISINDLSKFTEKALAKREEELRLLFDHASDSIFLTDLEGNFKDANQNALQMTGYSLTEIKDLSVPDLLDADDHKRRPWSHDRLNKGEKVLLERVIVKKDGSKLQIEVSSQRVGDQILTIVRDITERKEAESRLKANEALLREVGRIARVGGWEYSIASNKVYVEPGFNLNNDVQSPTSIHFSEWLTYFDSTNSLILAELIENCIEKHKPFDAEFQLTSPSDKRWVRVIGHPQFEDEAITGLRGTIQDITEHKENKEAIEEEKDLSDSLINSLPGVFYLYDQNGRFLRWNKNLEVVSGYSSAEIKAIHPLQFFSPEDQPLLTEKIQNVFENGSDNVEAPLLTKSGEKIPYYFTGSTINYNSETCLQGVGIDISDRVHAHQLLQTANEQLNTAQHIAKLGYWKWNSADAVTYWSDEMYSICAVPRENGPISEDQFFLMIHEKDREKFTRWRMETSEKAGTQEIEFRFIAHNNELKHLKCVSLTRFDQNNIFMMAEGTLQDISEAKIREEQIKNYNERFNVIAQTTSDAIFEWRPLNNTAWWSDSLYELFSFENKDTIPSFEEWLTKVHSNCHESIHKAIHEILEENRKEWVDELEYFRGDGTIGSLLIKAYVLREDNQVRILGGFVDITERKNHQRQIQKSNERYELISKATNDAIWDWDLNRNVINGNDNLRKIYGAFDDQKIISDELFFNKIHPDDVDRIKTSMSKALMNRTKVITEEYRFQYPDKSYRNILDRAFIMYNKSGLPVRMVGAMQDITEQKRSEIELQKLTNRLIMATTSANLGIFDWDISQDELVWNEFMYEMFEIDPLEFDHKFQSWLECLQTRDIHKFNLKNQTKLNKHIHETLRVVTVDERIKFIETYAVVIFDEDNQPNSVVGVCKDVTEAINSEQKITRAIITTQEEERFETGRELHDNVIQILVASLINLNNVKTEGPEIKHLKNGVNLAKRAIDEIRKLSHRMAPSNLGDLSLEDAVRNLLSEINTTHKLNIKFLTEIVQNNPISDDIKLNVFRILQEQLSNIIKHAEADDITIWLEVSKNKVYLRTKDNGKGFDASIVNEGIGLNNIKRRVKIFDGEILINSSVGNGCEIVIEIPIG